MVRVEVGDAKPDGTSFVDFLGNRHFHSADVTGVPSAVCFAHFCDWRLPTIDELKEAGILPCSSASPCPTIPGYWSSTSEVGSTRALTWAFKDGIVDQISEDPALPARAVRRAL